MNKQELIKKVEAWHIEKQTNDLKKQLEYLISEFGEFSGAHLKNDEIEVIDGLGDTFVVLINIARLSQHEINVDYDFECMDNATFPLIAGLTSTIGLMMTDTLKGESLNTQIDLAFKYLSALATNLNYSIWDCLQCSYYIISKRKGETVDGVFIKDGE